MEGMSRPRLLLIIAGILVSLGFTLWLVDVLVRLYTGLSYISPLLGSIVTGLIVLAIAALIVALVYYAVLFLRPSRPKPLPQVPVEKTEAAEQTLAAVQQQVDQIQDEVVRQALIDRSQEISAELSRGALRVVVFGTGSAGKTSIINAMLGQVAGQVGATMGTTEMGQTYRFQLRGVEREIWVTDTPGILEAGVAGTGREQRARQLAAEADLLLFVVDNDLRQSEIGPLRSLVGIGKRSILVFNKIDLYTDEDVEVLLTRLRQRVQNWLAPEDVVAIAANPQPVTLPSGERVQASPEILPLLRRTATILRTEGEDLMADNILLQSQRLSEETRQILDAQRRRQAEQVVDRYQWIGAGVVSVTPLPMVDLLAAAAVNAQMVVEIGRIYGCEMNLEQGKELAVSLARTLVSLGVVRGALEIFSLALQTNVATFLVGRAIQGAIAAYLTRIAGKSFIEYFRRNQSWGDGGMTEVVAQQFQLNRRDEFIQSFVQETLVKVVAPLKQKL